MLVSGWDNIAVVDLRDGYVLASHTLPCQPLTKPVLGDFTGDGWTDIVIVCPEGYVLLVSAAKLFYECFHNMSSSSSDIR